MQNLPKKPHGRWLGAALYVLLGVALGVLAGVRLAGAAARVPSFGWYALAMAWLFAALILAFYGQITLHEAGHLVGGLATGYTFCSYRIGSFQWQKEGGKLCVRRMSLAGTGGQCLLAPPPLVNGKMPYVLYNLGGPLANLLTAALFWGLSFACRAWWEPASLRAALPITRLEILGWALTLLLELLALLGLGFGLVNGIPLRLGGIDNDGRNALSLGSHPAALRALWVQLTVNAQQTQGVRLKDMPAEWFTLPKGEALLNPMTATLAVFAENRLVDEHDFAAVAHLIDELEGKQTAIPGVYQKLLLCDRLCCALLQSEDAAPFLQRWGEKEMTVFRKQMKNFLSVLRTEYFIALLVERDTNKAAALRSRFEARAKTHPSPADAASERELLALADAAFRAAVQK